MQNKKTYFLLNWQIIGRKFHVNQIHQAILSYILGLAILLEI